MAAVDHPAVEPQPPGRIARRLTHAATRPAPRTPGTPAPAGPGGGRAELTSAPGAGTRLRLILPRTDKPIQPPAEAPAIDASCAGKRVLLVEDNDQVRQFAQILLAELTCNVLTASCGDEAMEILRRESVDLLFTDVVMPGMSGIELASRAQEMHPGLPVLLASGYSEELVRGAARQHRRISKPYGLSELNSALSELMSRQPA